MFRMFCVIVFVFPVTLTLTRDPFTVKNGKVCTRSRDVLIIFAQCTRAHRLRPVSPATALGLQICSTFWPAVNQCVERGLVQRQCTNKDEIRSVLAKHSFMCDGQNLKASIQQDSGLAQCVRYLYPTCPLPNGPADIDWDSMTFQQKMQAFRRYGVQPYMECRYRKIKRQLTQAGKTLCLAHMKELWTYNTLGVNVMGMFGFYNTLEIYPAEIRS